MTTSPPLSPAIEANITAIKQGVSLLSNLGAERYTARVPACYNSSVGGHMRHIIDHYQSFLSGLGEAEIDYENRVRDARIENDVAYAGHVLEAIAGEFEGKFREMANTSVSLRVETAPGFATETSVLRELEFLLSHTIHHYALISVMTRLQGFEAEPAFGMAPSTLRYQQAQVACAR